MELGLYEERDLPTRADILEHAQGDIFKLDSWLDSLALPVGYKEKIYSDLESYNYAKED